MDILDLDILECNNEPIMEDAFLYEYFDHERYLNDIIMEAADGATKKNIFQRLWDLLKKLLRGFVHALRKLKNKILGKNNTSTTVNDEVELPNPDKQHQIGKKDDIIVTGTARTIMKTYDKNPNIKDDNKIEDKKSNKEDSNKIEDKNPNAKRIEKKNTMQVSPELSVGPFAIIKDNRNKSISIRLDKNIKDFNNNDNDIFEKITTLIHILSLGDVDELPSLGGPGLTKQLSYFDDKADKILKERLDQLRRNLKYIDKKMLSAKDINHVRGDLKKGKTIKIQVDELGEAIRLFEAYENMIDYCSNNIIKKHASDIDKLNLKKIDPQKMMDTLNRFSKLIKDAYAGLSLLISN